MPLGQTTWRRKLWDQIGFLVKIYNLTGKFQFQKVLSPFLAISCTTDIILRDIAINVFQIWPTLAGVKE